MNHFDMVPTVFQTNLRQINMRQAVEAFSRNQHILVHEIIISRNMNNNMIHFRLSQNTN